MNAEMIKFFLSSGVPCGFVDSEGELEMNLTMSDLLHSMIFSAEMKTLIEKVQAERTPFSLMCNLPANFKKSPAVWQFYFLPLFCSENGYLGTFFHAHEFLFLSPLEYVDGIHPYFCDFRVTVLYVISGYIPLPRPFSRVARSQAVASGGR